MRTHVYVDGFNFYYGCVKDTAYKWLDFSQLCARLLKRNDILSIKYFTARVEAPEHDPGTATRQDTYLRALRTIPDLEIIFGHFLTNEVRRWRADGSGSVLVVRREEKGSDVNLATHLLHDAHRGLMECAVLITNDSDLAGPVRIVREEIGLNVGVIAPTLKPGRYPSRVLVEHATFIKHVREGVIRDSQFPDPVTSADGEVIHKPASW